MKHIFLLEDDEALGRGIAMVLEGPDVSVTLCRTLAESRRVLEELEPSLLILDVNLPDGSGLALLRQIRQAGSHTPVILLTANDLELDEVAGLEAGADDYITKPFSLAILRARVGAQLRRDKPAASSVLSLGPFSFDFDRMDFRRDGVVIDLSKTEQKLLRLLVENRGRTVSRAAAVDWIWSDGGEYVDENALSVTMKRLRAKLERSPAQPDYLKTVYGIGYTWAVTP